MESLFEMLPTFAGMGKIGLIAFAACVVGYGVYKFWAGFKAYNKKVQQAAEDIAESAAGSNEALDNTDQMGDEFLDR